MGEKGDLEENPWAKAMTPDLLLQDTSLPARFKNQKKTIEQ